MWYKNMKMFLVPHEFIEKPYHKIGNFIGKLNNKRISVEHRCYSSPSWQLKPVHKNLGPGTGSLTNLICLSVTCVFFV